MASGYGLKEPLSYSGDTTKGDNLNIRRSKIKSELLDSDIPPSPNLIKVGFGTGVGVYRWRVELNKSPVAVKRTLPDIEGRVKDINSKLYREAKILYKLNHPNIVSVLGIKTQQDGRGSLILEFCQISLGDIIQKRYDDSLGPLSAEHIKKVCIDIPEALDYLHNQVRYLHGDMKSYNILIKGDFEICKICDFDCARKLDANGIMRHRAKFRGTEAWNPPEAFVDEQIITSKSDIFSFGLVIYECIALCVPHYYSEETSSSPANDMSKCENQSIHMNDTSVDLSMASLAISKEKVTKTSNTENESIRLNNTNVDVSMVSLAKTNGEETQTSINTSCNNVSIAFGTRPVIPDVFNLPQNYDCILALFYSCTNVLAEDRPSARRIVEMMS